MRALLAAQQSRRALAQEDHESRARAERQRRQIQEASGDGDDDIVRARINKTVDAILKQLGQELRVVSVDNGQVYVNDTPINQRPEMRLTAYRALRDRLVGQTASDPRCPWVEIGPMIVNLTNRRWPVMLPLEEVTETRNGRSETQTKVQVRVAFGRNARFFLPMSMEEAQKLAVETDRRRVMLNECV